MRILIIVLATFVLAAPVRADLLNLSNGTLTLLRVHDVGTGYGPPSDFIDVEVVVQVAERDGAFGFQLRDDRHALARQGMLDLLRDAMNNPDLRVNFDYQIEPPDKHGEIIRVWLSR